MAKRSAEQAMRTYEKEQAGKPKTIRGSSTSKAGWTKDGLGGYVNEKGDELYKSKSFKGRGGEWVLNGEKIANSSRMSVADAQMQANVIIKNKETESTRGSGGTSTSNT